MLSTPNPPASAFGAIAGVSIFPSFMGWGGEARTSSLLDKRSHSTVSPVLGALNRPLLSADFRFARLN